MFDFHIFADDTNLFYANTSIVNLESIINNNLKLISCWLKANKLSLSIVKTNYVIFHPPQKKNLLHSEFNLVIYFIRHQLELLILF